MFQSSEEAALLEGDSSQEDAAEEDTTSVDMDAQSELSEATTVCLKIIVLRFVMR